MIIPKLSPPVLNADRKRLYWPGSFALRQSQTGTRVDGRDNATTKIENAGDFSGRQGNRRHLGWTEDVVVSP